MAAVVCPVCRHAVDLPAAEGCARCATLHHRECLKYAGRCAVFGCEPGPAVPVKKPVGRRREIPFAEQMGRCLIHAAPVMAFLPLTLFSSMSGTTTVPRRPPALTSPASVTLRPAPPPSSALPPAPPSLVLRPPAPPSLSVLPPAPLPSRVLRPPPPPAPDPGPAFRHHDFACPARNACEDADLPCARNILDRIVLADSRVAAEHVRLVLRRSRKLLGICYETHGPTRLDAFLCYGSPDDGGCAERIVVVLRTAPAPRRPPTVELVECTAIWGVAAALSH